MQHYTAHLLKELNVNLHIAPTVYSFLSKQVKAYILKFREIFMLHCFRMQFVEDKRQTFLQLFSLRMTLSLILFPTQTTQTNNLMDQTNRILYPSPAY